MDVSPHITSGINHKLVNKSWVICHRVLTTQIKREKALHKCFSLWWKKVFFNSCPYADISIERKAFVNNKRLINKWGINFKLDKNG